MNFIVNILFSNRTSGLLLLFFALAMAIATFVENDFGTETAKSLIYGSKWFEIIMLLLAINFAGNIAKYDLFSWKKAPVFLFHLAFIIIILGAGITKYRGFEGLMTIKEGESSNQMISLESHLQIQVGNGHIVKNHISKPLRLSELGFNNIIEKIALDNKEISIQLKKYIPRAAYILQPASHGKRHLQVVIADKNERKDFYIPRGTRETIYGIPIAFDTKPQTKEDIHIIEDNGKWMASFPEDTNYFSMIENKASFYPKDSLVALRFRALSKIKGYSLVFKHVTEPSERILISKERNTDEKNAESAIVLQLESDNQTKEITLFGGRGYVNPISTIFINGLHLNMRYGSKGMPLPFSLYLKDFNLDRYPGSDSPSAFYSHVEIQEKNKLTNYTIFMNNVLDYKGYRFFQSAYLPDETGTILSVNKDLWGTRVTYLGYGLLGLGMFLSLFWKSSHFGTLLQFLKLKD